MSRLNKKYYYKHLFIFLMLSIIVAHHISAMDRPSTPPPSQEDSQGPSFATPTQCHIQVTNHCREILEAMQENSEATASTIASEFMHFMRKIPYPLKNIKHAKNVEQPSACLYKSLAILLCHCLQACTNIETKTRFYKITDEDIIYIPIACEHHIYVLQFAVLPANTRPELYRYKSEHPEDTITVISIQFILDEDNKIQGTKIRELNNNGVKQIPIMPLVLPPTGIAPYNTDHLYKEALWDVADQDFFNQVLSFLYNRIPPQWRVAREKFYQTIFVALLLFLGLGDVRAENITSKGRADVVLMRHRLVPIIFEFKLNGSAERALDQIKSRSYFDFTDRTVEMVGINIRQRGDELAFSTQHEKHVPSPIALNKITPQKKAPAIRRTIPTPSLETRSVVDSPPRY